MNKIDFNSIPTIGWICFIIIGLFILAIVGIVCFFVYKLFSKKSVKTKFLEIGENIRPEIKERYIAEGKDLIDNQSQVAKLLLKTARIRIYEEGIDLFHIVDEKDKTIFELITYRISDRLNYELKNDFTRNHIVNKTNSELEQYSNAKAKAYYRLITEKLYMFNPKLPNYNLPEIMTRISLEDAKRLFTDIYFSGRDIAGTKIKEGESA